MYLLWPIIGALIGAIAAQNRGYGVIGGVLAGALLGPFAFILFFVSGIISSSEQRKKCPFCAEWIRHEAIVCPHCQRNLPRIKS